MFCTKKKIPLFILAILLLRNTSAFAAASTTPPVNMSYEQEVFRLINSERKKNNMPALFYDSAVADVARTKSQDMADKKYFAHNSPTYGMASDMLLKFDISWSAWGENIASGQDTPEIVVREWMDSPTHRENILSHNFSFVGVGYYVDPSGTPYWTQMFIGDNK